ncbi:MAG TPA: AAA family ATPase [Candidatus Limnocylindria bacterium]|jgi:pilus assembly protein CpaE
MSVVGALTLVALESDPAAVSAIHGATADGQIALIDVVTDLPTLVAAVAAKHPMLVILDLGEVGDDVAVAVRSVLAVAPECCTIVTGEDPSPAVISRAVSAGARAFILRPFEADDLAATLRDALTNLTALRRLQRGEGLVPRQNRGSVIAVYSPKGGVGCTTIATNLAVALASRTKQKVGIIDLDLQFGDVGVALDLRSANSIVDLVAHADAVDDALIADIFVRHESGVRALVAPDNIALLESLDPARIVRSVEALRDHFAYIVCDLWSSLDDLTLSALRVADRIVLVTTPELPSLKNIRRVTAATAPLLLDERTEIVLNRHPAKTGVSVADVEKNLGRRVAATIPSEGVGMTDAINQGISFFDSRARVRASSSYLKLAESLMRDGEHRRSAEVGAAVRA